MSALLSIVGMTDPHVHLRDLGWAHKATFASETAAALAGGYTAVFDMPNTPPATTIPAALALKKAALAAGARCDWGVYYGGSQHDNTSDYPAVGAAVAGLKLFLNATTGDLLIEDRAQRAAHVRAWRGPRPIAVHAEGETVAEVLALVRDTGARVHFLHISTAHEIDLLRAAKNARLPVTVGVCPHHLYLTQADLPALGPLGLMKPELKTAADRDALWVALRDGTVDVVESDHAPHTLADKHNAAGQPVYGVPGLETTLPLLLLAVHEGRLALERVPELVAAAPRRIFGLPPMPDAVTHIDTGAAWTIANSALHTACGWSPFDGLRVRGRVVRVTLRGALAYEHGQVVAAPGTGQDLFDAGAPA